MKCISLKRLYKEYPYESLLLIGASTVSILSLLAFILTSNPPVQASAVQSPVFEKKVVNEVFIDVSGAVENPDVYAFSGSPRLKDVIKKAGGFSTNADLEFVNRNFNFSRFVSDQEKVYIPSLAEIQKGTFVEGPRTLEYLAPKTKSNYQAQSSSGGVSINTATSKELEDLEGIGSVLAGKIISNRPYTSLEELTKKKVVSTSQFNKIKADISL